MAKNRLFELFDGTNKETRNLVPSAPKSLNDMVASGSADATGLLAKIDLSNRVVPKVDYSDFSNFVFFNSALDYFNISGDRMLREWPYGGTFTDQLLFTSASDPYQSHLLSSWPKWQGSVDFSTGASIVAADIGYKGVNSVGGVLSTHASSFTIEAHIRVEEMPAAGQMHIIMQRASGTNETFTVYLDSTSINLSVKGVDGQHLHSRPIAAGSRWFAWAVERNANALTSTFYTTAPSNDALKKFTDGPFIFGSLSSTPGDAVDNIGTITLGSATVAPTGLTLSTPKFKLGEVRIWTEARSEASLFANYNLRVFAEDTLALYWRLNEPYRLNFPTGRFYGARDYSGNKITGKMIDGTLPLFAPSSFGMSPQDDGEYILPIDPQENATLWNWIKSTQDVASLYDRDNENIITRLVPSQFLYLEDERNTTVLKNLLYLMGRQFDEMKVKIDQFSKLLTANYTEFNQTPDALLADALQFWGWDTKGNFLNQEAFQHFFGYDVLTPSGSLTSSYAPPVVQNNQAGYDNQRLETTLNEIKTEFWKRTLNNLIYIYKTKGTKESVEALLRIYGLDDRLVKVKEFGLQPDVKIQTNRIASEKSAWAYQISGSNNVLSKYLGYPPSGITVDANVRFPATGWTVSTGTIFANRGDVIVEELQYRRSAIGGATGTLVYVSSNGAESVLGNFPIFDGQWYNISLIRVGASIAEVKVKRLDEDIITLDMSGTAAFFTSTLDTDYKFGLGKVLPSSQGSEMWVFNAQVWDRILTTVELNDHVLNPFSYGSERPEEQTNLKLNWQFDKEVDEAQATIFDRTEFLNNGIATALCDYTRFSITYNFIAPPDYGWSEDKIRVFSTTKPPTDQRWLENNIVAVEFNLIDALNEDISFMLASMDNWNNLIGDPANKHRASYPALDRFRQQYFSRLAGRINFRAFADFMDFFDRSFIELIKKLLPARVNFKGAELIVESHMLERPKVQYTYRRHDPVLVPEGTIVIVGHSLGVPEKVAGTGYTGSTGGSTTSPPSIPRNFTATQRGMNIILSWTPPLSLGSSMQGGYIVAQGGTTFSTVADLPFDGVNSATEITYADEMGVPITVIPETTYNFTILAQTADGSSPVASTSIVAFTPILSAPLNLVAIKVGTTLHLSWSPPASTGSGPVQMYNILWTNNFEGNGNASTGELFYDIPNATAGAQYSFSITAFNGYEGTSPETLLVYVFVDPPVSFIIVGPNGELGMTITPDPNTPEWTYQSFDITVDSTPAVVGALTGNFNPFPVPM